VVRLLDLKQAVRLAWQRSGALRAPGSSKREGTADAHRTPRRFAATKPLLPLPGGSQVGSENIFRGHTAYVGHNAMTNRAKLYVDS
jgi:hypothetical protein